MGVILAIVATLFTLVAIYAIWFTENTDQHL